MCGHNCAKPRRFFLYLSAVIMKYNDTVSADMDGAEEESARRDYGNQDESYGDDDAFFFNSKFLLDRAGEQGG